PANMTFASPILTVRQASPMAWLAVTQAEQGAKLGPRKFKYIETRPDAMFEMSMGIMNGESRPGPRSNSTFNCSLVVWRPQMPEPMNAPTWSGSVLVKSIPESLSACQAA